MVHELKGGLFNTGGSRKTSGGTLLSLVFILEPAGICKPFFEEDLTTGRVKVAARPTSGLGAITANPRRFAAFPLGFDGNASFQFLAMTSISHKRTIHEVTRSSVGLFADFG
jgi:hypothetical protein